MTGFVIPGRCCRVCGCTAVTACSVNITVIGDPCWVPCSWVEWDLCSGCTDGTESIPWDVQKKWPVVTRIGNPPATL